MDFSNINTNNKGTAALLNALKKTSVVKADYSRGDEWSITKDKDGNGAAVIRFIPSKDGELFQEVRSHGYKNKNTNRWYIENCPKTLDWEQPCPACEHANALMAGRVYKDMTKDEQEKIKPFFANTSYWANILVEKDDACPDNEGKVFKYRFGKKILEKIAARAADDPLDDSVKGINVFDLTDGASFKLVVKKVAGFPNYDTSSFKSPEKLFGGDKKKLAAMAEQSHDIGFMTTEKNFKEYAELKKKFYGVINVAEPAHKTAESVDTTTEKQDYEEPNVETSTGSPDASGTGDEDFDYFSHLSNENI
jgi:hypothetical protein